MPLLLANPEDRFYRVEAHIYVDLLYIVKVGNYSSNQPKLSETVGRKTLLCFNFSKGILSVKKFIPTNFIIVSR